VTDLAEWIGQHLPGLDARLEGPFRLRLVLQPTLAAIIAVRAALADARAGHTPYLWKVVTDPAGRRELLRQGWKHVRVVFTAGSVLDFAYQWYVQGFVDPLAMLLTATLLAVVPYLFLRGPVNRLVRWLVPRPAPA
jgi:hypothetical protein